MGYLELLFEINDNTLLDRKELTCKLGEAYKSKGTDFEVTIKPFKPSGTPRGLDRCYVSPDYQACFGDFAFGWAVLKEDQKYGPACVFAMGFNSAVYDDRIRLLQESLQVLENLVPGSLPSLVYIGLMIGDHRLIDEGNSKEKIEPLLRSLQT